MPTPTPFFTTLRLPIEGLTRHARKAFGTPLQNLGHDRLDRKSGRVEYPGIGRGSQGGDRAGRIPQIPFGDLARKGGKANTRPLVFQLLIAPKGPLVRARGEKYL